MSHVILTNTFYASFTTGERATMVYRSILSSRSAGVMERAVEAASWKLARETVDGALGSDEAQTVEVKGPSRETWAQRFAEARGTTLRRGPRCVSLPRAVKASDRKKGERSGASGYRCGLHAHA